MNSRNIGIRRLVTLSSVALAILTMVSLAALLGTTTQFQRSMETVTRDTRSAAIAYEIEVSVLLYQRLSNLLIVTGQPDLASAKAEVVMQIEHLLSSVREQVGGASEQDLIAQLSASLSNYLGERNRLDADGLELEEIVRRTSPFLTDLLAILTSLREVNDLQITKAQRAAVQIRQFSDAFGIGAGVLLVAGLVLAGMGVRRYVSRPILSLHNSMAAFRDGDLDARNGLQGVNELSELARIFNEMADTLAQHRMSQLAFLAGVAHDLKSPLSTLKNGMYLLEHEQSEVRRSLLCQSLDGQVDTLSRMVDDLLDATRIEAGQLELQYMEFDVRDLLQGIAGMFAASAPDHRLVLDLPDSPVFLNADHLRIEQVVRNLLSNAIKYSPGGEVIIGVRSAGSDALISVADHGIGIPQSEWSTIFLPFRRLKQAVAPGVGLGLSVVRRIVSAHGGTIEVDSKVGAGSTFRVRLPQAGARAAEDDTLRA